MVDSENWKPDTVHGIVLVSAALGNSPAALGACGKFAFQQEIPMSRSNTGGARKPASKFPQLRKQMQKNAIAKAVQETRKAQPKHGGKKQP